MMGLLLGCGRCRIGLNEACFGGELQSLSVSECLGIAKESGAQETDPRPTQTRGCGRLGRRSGWCRVVMDVVMYNGVVQLYDSSLSGLL